MSDLPPIEFAFPDLRKWEKGAAPYVHVLESGKAGPTVMVCALTHGNEICGAMALDYLAFADRLNEPCRFDVVAIDGVGTLHERVRIIEGAFLAE